MILVASEQLPSIEGAVEILMDVPFLRGPCRVRALLLQNAPPKGFPYEGKLSPKATDEVDSVT